MPENHGKDQQAFQIIHLVISSVRTGCKHVGISHFLFHHKPPGCQSITALQTIALFLSVVQIEYS